MRHTRAFQDPLRPVFKGLSDDGRDNWERAFGHRPLPNEKDALESYVRVASTGEKIPVGSHALREEPTPKKPPIRVPGDVFRMELNDLPRDMTLRDIIDATAQGNVPDFVRKIVEAERESEQI